MQRRLHRLKTGPASEFGKTLETTDAATVACENCDMCQFHPISVSSRKLQRVRICLISQIFIYAYLALTPGASTN